MDHLMELARPDHAFWDLLNRINRRGTRRGPDTLMDSRIWHCTIDKGAMP